MLSGVQVQALIQSFVRSTLTLTFVIAAARVVFSIKVCCAAPALELCSLQLHACQECRSWEFATHAVRALSLSEGKQVQQGSSG